MKSRSANRFALAITTFAAACFAGAFMTSTPARAVLLDVRLRGEIATNNIPVGAGPYGGLPIGTAVELRVIVDSDAVFSSSPENWITWYTVDQSLATFEAEGVPPIASTNISTDVFFAGGLYHAMDFPGFRLPGAQTGDAVAVIAHCQFDGQTTKHPFNGTHKIEENIGEYSFDFFTWLRYYRLITIWRDAGGSLHESDMFMNGTTFSIQPLVPAACDGDADGDGDVNVNDISFIVFRLGSSPGACTEGDVDGNGAVNVNDISYTVFRLGTCEQGGACG